MPKTGLYGLLLLLSVANLPTMAAPDYDLVIRDGRVIDPETKLNAVRDVGVRGGTSLR